VLENEKRLALLERSEQILSGKPKPESQFAKARRLLESKLKDGAVPAVDIMQLADEEGISFKTFKRAKDALGVVSFRRDGRWYWDLPVEVVYEEGAQEERHSANGQRAELVPLTA
jgi:hypothetical protein